MRLQVRIVDPLFRPGEQQPVVLAQRPCSGQHFDQFTAAIIRHKLSPNPKVVGRILHTSHMIRLKMEAIMMHLMGNRIAT